MNLEAIDAKAKIDFTCLSDNCDEVIQFDLIDVAKNDFQAVCPKCHSAYEFDDDLRNKLQRMLNLVLAIREAEDILGDCNVAVNVPAGEVKIPYALLLTRLNTMITLQLGDKKVDFHVWVAPSSPDTFR
ncbi:hypothetical protein AAEX28_12755 [Lentisphaerota bacterium WC36G]|nr:hypothetical protein LJT99_15575 [Lentisphaerae bacterium WC36]